jgi:hypothetical protein
MKRSSYLVIACLLLLTGFTVYTYLTKSKATTVDDKSRAFNLKDTASVTKIFIADKEGNKSLIKRGKDGWTVNDKFRCRSEAILNLLEVIRNVEVKSSVPKEAKESVIKFMSFNAIKVEIYSGDDLIRQYYVGHETPDGESSYLILTDPETGKNYKDPYICFIPGFIGYLQPRYIANENEWRDRLVINYTPPQVSSINVRYNTLSPDSSFTIDLLNTTTFRLRDGKGQAVAFDEAKLKQYLIYFQNISYEVLITGKNKKLQDSLTRVGPFCTISVTGKSFKTDTYKFFRKRFEGAFNPELGVKYEYDPDRLYMTFDNDRQWAVVQYFVFGKLFVSPGYFKPASVKK